MNTSTTDFANILHQNQQEKWIRAIDSSKIISWLDDLFRIIFPEKALDSVQIELLLEQNKTRFIAILTEINKDETTSKSRAVADSFYVQLPTLYSSMQQDAQAILDTDPAADCSIWSGGFCCKAASVPEYGSCQTSLYKC